MKPPFYSSGPLARSTQGNRQGSCSWGYLRLGNGKKLEEKIDGPSSRANFGVACLERRKSLQPATSVRWLLILAITMVGVVDLLATVV